MLTALCQEILLGGRVAQSDPRVMISGMKNTPLRIAVLCILVLQPLWAFSAKGKAKGAKAAARSEASGKKGKSKGGK